MSKLHTAQKKDIPLQHSNNLPHYTVSYPRNSIFDSEKVTYTSEMNLPLISGDIKVAFKSECSLWVKVCEDNRNLNWTLV